MRLIVVLFGFMLVMLVDHAHAVAQSAPELEVAEQVEKARAENDYATIYLKVTPLADKGDPWSQTVLGDLYLNGHVVAQDDSKAFDLFRLSAEQGFSEGQYRLGLMYLKHKTPVKSNLGRELTKLLFPSIANKGVDEKYQEDALAAVDWLTKAAKSGHLIAASELAELHRNPSSGVYDQDKSAFWMQKVAEQGNASAQQNMGLNYAEGRGVPKDHQQAAYWYEKAAAQDYAPALNSLATLYEKGLGVVKDDAWALALYVKAAKAGDGGAQYTLGLRYLNGQGVTKNLQQAGYWFEKAASNGQRDAPRRQEQVRTQILEAQYLERRHEQDERDLSKGYKETTFSDFLLDAPTSKYGTKVRITAIYRTSGEIDALYENIQASHMPNSHKIILSSEDAPRETRKSFLQLRSSACGITGVCSIQVLGKTAKCSVSWMGRQVRTTTCLAVEEVRSQ